jgi:hypothetical protein
MEWLRHDYRNGGVVDISAVDIRNGVMHANIIG